MREPFSVTVARNHGVPRASRRWNPHPRPLPRAMRERETVGTRVIGGSDSRRLVVWGCGRQPALRSATTEERNNAALRRGERAGAGLTGTDCLSDALRAGKPVAVDSMGCDVIALPMNRHRLEAGATSGAGLQPVGVVTWK